MKTIKFKNNNGVEVSYKQAGVAVRIIAFIFDFGVYALTFWLLKKFFGSFTEENSLLLFIVTFIMSFVPLMVEIITHGQSPGKMLMGICIVSNFGRPCTTVEYFTRFVVKIIEISLSLGLLPIVLISFSSRGQSLSDLFAGTTVVVKKKSTRFTLKEITDIDTAKTYQVSYPEVRRLHEKDVIILKTLLNEHKHKQASSNQKLIAKASQKLENILGVNKGQLSNKEFLNKIITDYIIATR